MDNLELIKIILAGICSIYSFVVMKQLHFAYKKFVYRKRKYPYIEMDKMPTVSVCIPVRNESYVIKDSLDKVLNSDYPKLEIIVLDDESVDNTSDLVKSFAHKGIRFIKGKELEEGWIGKNKALSELFDQAMGEYILFLGIDTKIGKNTISDLVYYMLNKEVEMISVMPKNNKLSFGSIFGTMRFFWEIILHSESTPAINTGAWMVQTNKLEEYNDFFTKHKATTRPEASLASYFYDNNMYHFLIANKNLEISHNKDWRSQVNTSIRTLAPLFEKSAHLGVVIFLILLIIFGSWTVFLLDIIKNNFNIYNIILLFGLLLINFCYSFYLFLSKPSKIILGVILTPFYYIQEFFLLIISYIKYSYLTISWKGRKLPDIED